MHTPKFLKAGEFLAENQPLEMPVYDNRVKELAEEVRDGEIEPEEAEEEAVDTLINETFGTFGSNDEGH